MDNNFWLNKWRDNNIAFHESEANPLLVKHFSALSVAAGSRVFLPLCGKTSAIGWLLAKGYRVAGAELSEIAIEQLFEALEIAPNISVVGKVKRYSANDIDIFVGDLFDLSGDLLGPVDAIYDRAALVALPEATRKQYTAHLMKITDDAPQLLICYDYDQTLMSGPPFAISDNEVNQHYEERYNLSLLVSRNMPNGLKGECAAEEKVWLLKND